MQDFQRQLIELSLRIEALAFGSFTLKSGRISPYFFNAGKFSSGAALDLLSVGYARLLKENYPSVDTLFGPAYKGIPLVSATALAFHRIYNQDLPYCFNRKEAKTHGEGGVLIGAPLQGKVIIIDDVITAGTAIRDAVAIIKNAGAELAGVALILDRQEKGIGSLSTVQEISETYDIPVKSLLTLETILDYAEQHLESSILGAIAAYRAEYGIKS